jgi:hypothetical protein
VIVISAVLVISQSSLIGSSYDDDYYDAPSIACSPGTPFKFFVNEAAADVPLAPRLLLPTDGARSSSGVDDSCNREAESGVSQNKLLSFDKNMMYLTTSLSRSNLKQSSLYFKPVLV